LLNCNILPVFPSLAVRFLVQFSVVKVAYNQGNWLI